MTDDNDTGTDASTHVPLGETPRPPSSERRRSLSEGDENSHRLPERDETPARPSDGDDQSKPAAPLRRRSLLKTLSVPPLAMALAGCPGDSGGGSTPAGPTSPGPPEDLSSGARLAFEDAVRYPESYELTVTVGGEGEQGTTVTGRVDGGDQYIRTESDGLTTETYVVDEQAYVVTDDSCVQYSARRAEQSDPPDPDEAASLPEMRLAERTTLDGREMYRFELTPSDRENAATVTYFVDVRSGYLRRIETGTAVVDYSSWGSVDPVTAPDRDCQEYEPPTDA